ncbi:hypothetical protein CALCODRAFT_505483 [Calocera cornea HHB12733]|uniref:Uncharacterized protein n=1 Tax=Calocera cornea HHB12733 TaxID=1353952 RepID=A0A165K634_9BASI|nr:hypothetical protein CALCODRAFT_505483 [Calocera cornea HHB12733]
MEQHGAYFRRSVSMFDNLQTLMQTWYEEKTEAFDSNIVPRDTLQDPEEDVSQAPVRSSISGGVIWAQMSGLERCLENARRLGNTAYEAAVLEYKFGLRLIWACRGARDAVQSDYNYVNFLLDSIHICPNAPCSCEGELLTGSQCLRNLWAAPELPRLRPELPFGGLLQHPLLASLYALIFNPNDTSDFIVGDTYHSVVRQVAYISTLLAAAANCELPDTELDTDNDEDNFYHDFYDGLVASFERGSMEEMTQFITVFSVEVGLRMRLMSEAEGIE